MRRKWFYCLSVIGLCFVLLMQGCRWSQQKLYPFGLEQNISAGDFTVVSAHIASSAVNGNQTVTAPDGKSFVLVEMTITPNQDEWSNIKDFSFSKDEAEAELCPFNSEAAALLNGKDILQTQPTDTETVTLVFDYNDTAENLDRYVLVVNFSDGGGTQPFIMDKV